MTTLFAGTLGSGARITDFAVLEGDAGTVLIAGAQPGAGLLSFRLDPDGTAVYAGGVAYPAGADLLGQTQVALLDMPEGTLVLPAGRFPAEMTGALVSGTGQFGPFRTLADGAGRGGEATVLEAAEVGGQAWLFGAAPGAGEILAWSVAPDGSTLAPAAGFGDTREAYAAGVSALATAKAGDGPWLFAASAVEDGVSAFRIGADGTLAHHGAIGAADGLGLDAPAAIEAVTLDGETFVVVAATGSSSLSVLRVTSEGLRPTDHVVDTLGTRFQSVAAFDTVLLGDRAYVVAGGADDGISLFHLLPDGRLILAATVEDTAGAALADVAAIRAVAAGGAIDVFVASASENGLSQFRIDPGAAGLTLRGGAGADTLRGAAGDDLLLGGGGHDSLMGEAGHDILVDGSGEDTLVGGAGADLFVLLSDGQIDVVRGFDPLTDRLDLSDFALLHDPAQLVIAVTATGATLRHGSEIVIVESASGGPLGAADFTRVNTLNLSRSPVETILAGRIEAGTDGSDTIRGTVFGDRLEGRDGADMLEGGPGDDTLAGGAGADRLEGGSGSDTADYAGALASVTADLAGLMPGVGDAAGDAFVAVENLAGSAFGDLLAGDGGANRLDGGAGDDTLAGGDGGDVLDGGPGRDRADYAGAPGGVTADLGGAEAGTGEGRGDVYRGVEDLGGSAFADRLTGDSGANGLRGAAGNDTLRGLGGDDTLTGGAGADRLEGGEGFDTAAYGDAPAGMLADMLNPARGTGHAAGDVFLSVEAMDGTSWGDDLRGDALANRLSGGGGVDWLMGRAGNDTLVGGEGNDNLIGGAGADRLDGGAGFDRAHYSDATAGVQADLVGQDLNTGAAAGDVFVSIEGFRGSSFGDDLRGDGLANVLDGAGGNDRLDGRGGNDQLIGRAGDDVLEGGDGNDVIFGGAGADTLAGGAGTDRANYGDSALGVVADLADPAAGTGFAAGDVYVGIENLQGSMGNDTLRGDAGANMITGGRGDDRLEGRGGADYLIGAEGHDRLHGGEGADLLHGGEGADVFVFRPGDGADRILDFAAGTDTLWLEGFAELDGRTAADVVADHAVVVAGGLWFDFGGDTLFLRGITDADLVVADLVIG